jgi:hypothetical protein
MLSVILVSVIKVSAVMLSVIQLCTVILSVIMLSVVMLSVILLNVVALLQLSFPTYQSKLFFSRIVRSSSGRDLTKLFTAVTYECL